jgi:Ala-tRNA(Pro) deacylase
MTIATTVGDALEFEEIDFKVLRHGVASNRREIAATAGISPDSLAKAVLLKDAHGYVLTVMPATREPDLEKLCAETHRQLRVAGEDDLDELFCDCVVGSVPPIGPWYRVPTIVDSSLRELRDVYFEAGDDDSLVHVTETSFERLLEGAEYLAFSRQARLA